ncbi:MAG: hypothetical protein RBS17_09355 [Coriobacteriia bacterium]|nr:hypothetical protein [Coriobacteriia bacterium]
MDSATESHYELTMIAADCQELVNLAIAMNHFGMAPEAALGQMPLFSWFAGESHRALVSHLGPTAARELGHEMLAEYQDAVTKARARLKLFDDTRGGIDGLLETFELARHHTREWFNKDHQGILGRLKRRLQPDLGIFWIGSRPALTTHTAILTMGMDRERLERLDSAILRETMQQFASEFSQAVGAYVGRLGATFEAAGMLVMPSADNLNVVDVQFTHTDHHANRAYEQVQRGFGFAEPHLAVAAMFVATQVNYARSVLPTMLRPEGFLLLRARFLSAYHATSALRELSQSVDSTLPGGAALLDSTRSESSQLLELMRAERNLMAHYGLRGRAAGAPADGNAFEWAVGDSSGLSLGDLSAIVGAQLDALAAVFDGVADKRTLRASRAILGDNT